jgi:hypothetical protein
VPRLRRRDADRESGDGGAVRSGHAGLFKEPGRINRLQERSELSVLRERMEFQKMLEEWSEQKDQ